LARVLTIRAPAEAERNFKGYRQFVDAKETNLEE
jgi:hypothetical protein